MIGVDIVKIERIISLVQKDKNNKVFSKQELEYASEKVGKKSAIQTQHKMYESLAGMFAAKEAFLKAMGEGIGGELALGDIEIVHNNIGKPSIERTEKIEQILKGNDFGNIDLSISHDGEYAIAVVQIN